MNQPMVVVDHSEHPQPAHNLAAPVVAAINGADMAGQPVLLLKTIGGLTKLEQAAIAIGAAVAGRMTIDPGRCDVPGLAVDMADSILAECRRRQEAAEPAEDVELVDDETEDGVEDDRCLGDCSCRRNGHREPPDANIILPPGR
ncbi:MAG TPA: hypothetical protein VHC22_32560 [Pirellulales bacterium]|nr:hypothetical protein [Pirellulales bacterium]